MTANYAKAENLTIASGSKTLNQFSDAANVSDWAKEGMQYCIEHGLLSGNDQGKSGPKAQPNGVADGRNGKDSVTGYRSDVETEK